MSRCLLALSLVFLPVLPVKAQNQPLRATHLDSVFMSLVDVDSQAGPIEGIRSASAHVFMAHPEEGLFGQSSVDYLNVQAQYDCRVPGRWRMKSMSLYSLERSSKPIETVSGEGLDWKMASTQTPSWATWEAVCRQKFDETEVSFDQTSSPLEILRRYRQLLRTAS